MRMKSSYPPALFVLAVVAISAWPAAADMTVKFADLRPDATTRPGYVSFGGGGTLIGKNLSNNAALAKGVSYRLDSLTKGISITEFTNGRIYLSLGAKLTTPNAANGYSPNFANASLADYATRWDKVEITFAPVADKPSAGGANLSAQDFFSVPLRIVTTGGGKTPTTLTGDKETAPVMAALGGLAKFAIITKANATGAIALSASGVTVVGVTAGKVVRVISPASVAPKNAAGVTVYPSFAAYVISLRKGDPSNPGQPVRTIIAGNNGQIGTGGPLQTYNLTATIANQAGTVGGAKVKAGDLVLTGNVDNGAGNVQTTILVAAVNLSDHAIYGANPTYTIVKGADTNGIVEKVLADFFAALNFGFVGSPVDNPGDHGTTIGASPSWAWYGNRPSGVNRPPLPIDDAFAFAQPGKKTNYNQYAAYLTGASDAYGFAYNDRLQSPLAPLSDGSVLTLSILPDKQ